MLFTLLPAIATLLSPTSAATWYFLSYNLPSSQAFLSFSGTMQIPKLPKAGTYYLWPGLQPTDSSAVYAGIYCPLLYPPKCSTSAQISECTRRPLGHVVDWQRLVLLQP
ncbi:hypothetical protein PMIN06_006334 [Paraphaeosphaeria minitans]